MSKKMLNSQKDVKLSKRCQIVKHLDYGGASQKKIDIMRFTDVDINFDIRYMKVIKIAQKYFL